MLAASIVEHLSLGRLNLADYQFGFRKGQSTIDAVRRVRSLSASVVCQGDMALSVSLNLANAFNTLSRGVIRRGLESHGVAANIRAVIEDYLCDRWIEYPGWYGCNGEKCTPKFSRDPCYK